MSTQIKVPMLPESVADATVVTWHKKVGDFVKRDENLVDLETDKVVLEVPAPADGVLEEIRQNDGATVVANDVLGVIKAGATAAVAGGTPAKEAAKEAREQKINSDLSPAVRRIVAEKEVDVSAIKGSGKDGRLTKQDVVAQSSTKPASSAAVVNLVPTGDRMEKRVPMSRIRAKVAERLVQAQHNAAMLTTFNEVNLQAVMNLRNQYKDKFEKMHGVKLGFMSFFTKAVVEALKRFPAVNASIDGTDILYHGYYDIGIAVSTERGLVVPVIRNADQKSLKELVSRYNELVELARERKLPAEATGGSIATVTNYGTFGLVWATPIPLPEQTLVLGMGAGRRMPHWDEAKQQFVPVIEAYLTLSFDHRVLDGGGAGRLLARIGDLMGHPELL